MLGLACTEPPSGKLGKLAATGLATASAGLAAGGGAGAGSTLTAGTGVLTAGAAVTAGAGVATFSVASTRTTIVPSPMRSPSLTRTSLTMPAAEAGTSMVALSDSSVTRASSILITSPGLTNTSMTGTSGKSPMSGTLISINWLMLVSRLNRHRVRFVRIQLILGNGGSDFVSANCAFVGQCLERSYGDPVPIYLEELT